ncbi:hypothetical protein C7N43_13965 [Sphingobacteriales bacterium UPWRP_1]|nr:hypothetical protein B6N25_10080 [Sphingobacteriales bacterium TSM_CSS]PSJ76405.1 hypothetical protein C7N43_13965 [Sphingobacteriales bacterium UPWRP_1]
MRKRIFVALLLLFGACQTEKTNTEILTGNTWRIIAWTVSPPILGITDWYANSLPCETDNLYSFATNGTATIDEGPAKCNTTDPQTNTGSWAFNTAETQLTLVSEGITQVWEIDELTNSLMKIRYTMEDNTSGTSHVHSITFKAQ